MDKVCNKCGETKALELFPLSKRGKNGRQAYCRTCDNTISRDHYEKNKEKMKRDMWSYDLKRLYDLSVEDYNLLLKKQFNCCRICGDQPSYRLCVDHDHRTNKVRGLLCKTCNLGLGKFKDDPLLLRLAAIYLENSNED